MFLLPQTWPTSLAARGALVWFGPEREERQLAEIT